MLVDLVEESEILVKLGHELCQLRTFELSCAFAVTNGHAIGRAADHYLHELAIVFDVLLELAFLNAIERWLRNVYVATLDQLGHVAEEEREQQRANVRSVHVSIGHEDYFAIAKPCRIEIVFADPAT